MKDKPSKRNYNKEREMIMEFTWHLEFSRKPSISEMANLDERLEKMLHDQLLPKYVKLLKSFVSKIKHVDSDDKVHSLKIGVQVMPKNEYVSNKKLERSVKN